MNTLKSPYSKDTKKEVILFEIKYHIKIKKVYSIKLSLQFHVFCPSLHIIFCTNCQKEGIHVELRIRIKHRS